MDGVAEPLAGISGSLTAYFDGSLELLRTIANVLDIRPVFPRVSDIARKMVPHDALVMASFNREGQVNVEAAAGDFPALQPFTFKTPVPDYIIIRDLNGQAYPVDRGMDPTERIIACGFRSSLGIFTRLGDQVLQVGFWSKEPSAYDDAAVPLARRIADHIIVAMSHERLSRRSGESDRTRPVATRTDPRVRELCEELTRRTKIPIVGESVEWQDALRKATQVAATETTVLLTGESGTGKEVVARFIHQASARKTGPFVALNCAALPEQLLEAELFGFERGAFTSAHQAKPGQIELASGGVLFLDEVSEMSLSAQAKFLRVLQEREFLRLGGTRVLKANIRVVAATNRDLWKAVEEGAFREDLYYRLKVFDIRMAPLRERRTDILPLSESFLREIGRSFGRPAARLSSAAREALLKYDWPGNVRELRNALERAAILTDDGLIDAGHLALQPGRAALRGNPMDLPTVERETIAKALHECRWNKSNAAKRLGLSRTQLYVRMRRYGLGQAAPA